MELKLSAERQMQLAEIARHEDTTVDDLMTRAALRIISADDRFREAVLEGIAAADRGELISHEEVVARMEQLFAAR